MTQIVTPQFRITDAQRSITFYVDGLGFIGTDDGGQGLGFTREGQIRDHPKTGSSKPRRRREKQG